MIAIVDYGMGNLRSAQKAFEYVGLETIITEDKGKLLDSRAIVVPGVGAFYDAMKNIRAKGLDDIIAGEVKKGKPVIGICLGMQLLFERGFEVQECEGLALLKGDILRIPAEVKIPHMGWNQLESKGDGKLMKGIEEAAYVYFVHSYYAKAANPENVKAITSYGIDIPAIVEQDNIFGLQFHPEKSSNVGLKILDNFRRVIEC